MDVPKACKDTIGRHDKRGQGRLLRTDALRLLRALKVRFSDQDLFRLFDVVDNKGDDSVSYEAFIDWIFSDGPAGDASTAGQQQPQQQAAGQPAVPSKASAAEIPQPLLTDVYDIDDSETLGEGTFGAVSKAVNKQTKAVRALKTCAKERCSNVDDLWTEVRLMEGLDHPHILKLYGTFEDHRNVYILTELCAGGELFDRIADEYSFTEMTASHVMLQLFRGVQYLHFRQIMHRDLKPENLLLTSTEAVDKSTIKIIDFGTATRFEPGERCHDLVGTLGYVSPQILMKDYTEIADLFACGAILYMMLCGSSMFPGTDDEELKMLTMECSYDFDDPDWDIVSDDAKALIEGLVAYEEEERFTVSKALGHVWIKNNAPKRRATMNLTVIDNLRKFKSMSKFKKAVMQVMVHEIGDDEVKGLRDTFLALDTDGDGKLTVKELQEGIRSKVTTMPVDLEEVVAAVDMNGNNSIDYTEFIAAALDARQYHQKDVCWAAFRRFDKDGNGKISKEELMEVFADPSVAALVGPDAVKGSIALVDADGNGEIDFAEFMKVMQAEP